VRGLPGKWEVLDAPDDMASLFMWADIAVTGDGLTKYESAVTGTPSIVVSRPNSDLGMNDEFLSAGTAWHVAPDCDGRLTQLPQLLAALIADAPQRDAMTRRGRELVDGHGIARVIARIPMLN
jgi:spore coat polysaccharide biosynthesis predicted glycosyltransferase SpsG